MFKQYQLIAIVGQMSDCSCHSLLDARRCILQSSLREESEESEDMVCSNYILRYIAAKINQV